jgi:hypothetical protein
MSDRDGLGLEAEPLDVLLRPGAPMALIPPVFDRHGDEFTVTWPEHHVAVALTDVHKNRDGIKAELAVTLSDVEVHWGQLNLVSTSAREQLVKKLSEIDATRPWRSMLERACRRAVAAIRTGAPIVQLTGQAPLVTPDLVAPFVLEGQTTTIYADGDSGKSLLAAAIAVALTTGQSLPGGIRARRQAPVLVCDWETDHGPWDGRLAGLCAGLGLEIPSTIHYREMTAALTDDLTMLAAEAARIGVGLVIIDSLAPACGPEPDGTDAVVRTLNALRAFSPAARLVLAHVSKADAALRDGARPFGSVFTWNLSRSLWEIRRDQDSDPGQLTMALTHRKNNTGRRHEPLGLRFAFSSNTITPYPVDLGAKPQLAPSTSLAWRIRVCLASGRQTPAAIADTLSGADVETVSRTLRRLRKEKKARDYEDGTWGLTDTVSAVSGHSIRPSPKAGVS